MFHASSPVAIEKIFEDFKNLFDATAEKTFCFLKHI